MSRATPQMRDLAQRLIAHETYGKGGAKPEAEAVLRICELMRAHLGTLMGNGGFRALLSRAVAVAGAEVPWLRGLVVHADGSLTELAELESQYGAAEFTEGATVLLAQFFGLLATFIGEEITLRIVREVWPKLALTALKLSKGDKP